MSTSEPQIDQGEVARRAYEIWESRGCPPGDGMEDWNAALAELLALPAAESEPEDRPASPGAPTQREEASRVRVWFMRVKRKLIGPDA